MKQRIVEGCQLATELIIIATERANNDKVTRHVLSSMLSVHRMESTITEVAPSRRLWGPLIILEQNKTSQLSRCLLNTQEQQFFPAVNKV